MQFIMEAALATAASGHNQPLTAATTFSNRGTA
jgi:hypothetical protein